MTQPETQSPTNTAKPDFSNYRWVNAARNPKQSASVSLGQDLRVYLGLKGWAKTAGAYDYVSIELDALGIDDLRALLLAASAGTLPQVAATPTPAAPAAPAAPSQPVPANARPSGRIVNRA